MRSTSPTLLASVAGYPPHLVTLTVGGVAYRWTTADRAIVSRGSTWTVAGTGSSPGLEMGKARWALGLEVSTYDLTLLCGDGAMLGADLLTRAAAAGALNEAEVLIERAITTEGEPTIMHWFEGIVTSVGPTSSRVDLTVSSLLHRLNAKLPIRTFQAKCSYALFDSNCGATRPAATVRGVWNGGAPYETTRSSISFGSTDPDDHWTRGTVQIGGVARTVVSSVLAAIPEIHTVTVDRPFPAVPPASTPIYLVQGCDKIVTTCDTRWSRKAHFGGHPYIPSPMVAR